MFEKKLFTRAFAVLTIVALMSIADNKLYLTWTIWWSDMLMHFLAGGVVGMTVILLALYFPKYTRGRLKILFWVIFGALVVGILWEVFELHFDLTSLSDGMDYVTDTASDLCMDVLGSVIFYLLSLKFIKNNA